MAGASFVTHGVWCSALMPTETFGGPFELGLAHSLGSLAPSSGIWPATTAPIRSGPAKAPARAYVERWAINDALCFTTPIFDRWSGRLQSTRTRWPLGRRCELDWLLDIAERQIRAFNVFGDFVSSTLLIFLPAAEDDAKRQAGSARTPPLPFTEIAGGGCVSNCAGPGTIGIRLETSSSVTRPLPH